MYTTASKDVRKVLSTEWGGLCNKYERYDRLMGQNFADLQAAEKKELDELRRDICLWEFDRVESPSLRLSKFVHIGDNSKRHECDAVVNISRKSQRALDTLVGEFQFERSAVGEIRFMMRLQGRLIVSHTGGVLENAGLCIHPHAGVPYIPGSAVKGVARHAAWCGWANSQDGGDENAAHDYALKIALSFGYPTNERKLDQYCAKQWPTWFGAKGSLETFAGLFAFMPVFPAQSLSLVTDIVNCHHPKYYMGKQREPYCNEPPNPQFFPAVESGCMFTFIVRPLPRCRQILASMKDIPLSFEQLCLFAEQSLRKAAEEHGFGSKTSNGYGWFAEDTDVEQAIIRQKEDEQKRLEEKRLAAQDKADEEKKRSERKKRDEELAALSPLERAQREIAGWDENKWRTVLSLPQLFSALDDQIKVAVVQALSGPRSNLWETLKQTAQSGKKKEKKAAQPIRDEIYVIAKNQNPRIKMP